MAACLDIINSGSSKMSDYLNFRARSKMTVQTLTM